MLKNRVVIKSKRELLPKTAARDTEHGPLPVIGSNCFTSCFFYT